MKAVVLFAMAAVSMLMGGNLAYVEGSVKAHTEVFGDSSIDPQTSSIVSHLSMDEGITSIMGTVEVSMTDLASDNSSRDENMQETIESNLFPTALYNLSAVTEEEGGYLINGTLEFHGVKHPFVIVADILKEGKQVKIKGQSAFLMSDYGVEPPVLLFLTVRDKVDIMIDVTLKEE